MCFRSHFGIPEHMPTTHNNCKNKSSDVVVSWGFSITVQPNRRPSDIRPRAPCERCGLTPTLAHGSIPNHALLSASLNSLFSVPVSGHSIPCGLPDFILCLTQGSISSGHSLGDSPDKVQASSLAMQTRVTWTDMPLMVFIREWLEDLCSPDYIGGRLIEYLSWLDQDLWGVGPCNLPWTGFLTDSCVTSVL